jgi:hypothetical protein
MPTMGSVYTQKGSNLLVLIPISQGAVDTIPTGQTIQ